MPSQPLQRLFLLFVFFLSCSLVFTPNFAENGENSPFPVLAQDAEHIIVNATLAGTIFSAWDSPTIALPSSQVYAVETALIDNIEELLVCNELGDILAFQFQTPNQVFWKGNIRDGDYDADIIGYEVEAADFTGDGLDDILVVGPGAGFVEGLITYHANLGNRVIDTPGYLLVNGAFSVAAGDFDGNGTIDIFGWTWTSDGYILWNPGDGFLGWEFAPGTWEYVLDFDQKQSSVAGYQSITAGDIDNDGRDEVVLFGTQVDQRVYIYELLENGTFAFKQQVGYSGPRCYTAMGDVNGDGWLDLVISNGFASIIYLENFGNGTLGAPQSTFIASATPHADIALMDIDKDDKDDLIVINEHNEVMIFWTSFIPPESDQEQESDELGLVPIMTIVVVIIPIVLLAILRNKPEKGKGY